MSKYNYESTLNHLKSLYIDKETKIQIPGMPQETLYLMDDYIRERENIGLSNATLKNDLKAFVAFSRIIRAPVNELTKRDIYTFFDFMKTMSNSSIQTYKILIKNFLVFAGRPDLEPLFKFRTSRTKSKLPEELLSPEEIERMIESAITIRDKAYIATIYETGARLGELEELQIKHLKFDENGSIITFPSGKTGARRVRAIFAASYLRNWLANHPIKDDKEAWLWASSRQPSIKTSINFTRNMLTRAAKRAEIQKRIYPHLFRHSRATYLAQHLTEPQMKSYLGWTAGSKMTAIYVHLSGKDIDDAILRMNGLIPEDSAHDTTLKTVKCPRCKEIQDKKVLFCCKCGMPLNQDALQNIASNERNSEILMKVLDKLLVGREDAAEIKKMIKEIN